MSVNWSPSQAGGPHLPGPRPGGRPGPSQSAPNAPGFDGPAAAPLAPPPVTRERDNLRAGLVAGALAAIVAGLAYGVLLRAIAHGNGHTTELAYGPVAAGALVGIAAGKAGGRDVVLPFAALALTAFSVVLGGLFGTALIESHLASGPGLRVPVTDIFFHHFGYLCSAWAHSLTLHRLLGALVALAAAYGLALRFGDR